MNKIDVIRAWRDPEYRATLTEVPAQPAGLIELSDEELESAAGLASLVSTTQQACTEYTFRGFRRCCP
jgi:mersacidin/lichenicidin family type 2 lantibiotic